MTKNKCQNFQGPTYTIVKRNPVKQYYTIFINWQDSFIPLFPPTFFGYIFLIASLVILGQWFYNIFYRKNKDMISFFGMVDWNLFSTNNILGILSVSQVITENTFSISRFVSK